MDQPLLRPPAVKLTIQDILASTIHQDNQDLPLYLLSLKGEKVFRLNIMATILNIERIGSISNILIDDGTGKIILRFFEDNKLINNLAIGKCINVIGKARIYNEENYIAPEIVKGVSLWWLKGRSLELRPLEFSSSVETKIAPNQRLLNQKKIEEKKESVIKEEEVSCSAELELLPNQKVIRLIKELDQGEGALIDEIISNSSLKDIEQLLDKMLEKGEIFQITPGKIKVL